MRVLSQREAYAYRFGMVDDEYDQHAAHVDSLLTNLAHQGVETRTMPEYSRGISNGKTHWTPERRKQHQEIIRHFYDQMQNTPQEGKAMILGGLGGAGKGHVQAQEHIPLDPNRYFTINPDDIKTEMARRGMIPRADHLSPMEATGLAHEEASDLAKRVAMLGYRQKRNLIWDITMSGDKSVANRINTMRRLGYNQIDGVFVDADPAKARERVKKRHRQDEEPYRDAGFQGEVDPNGKMLGGRWVPEELTRGHEPSPGSGMRSKNAEVFDRLRPQFDNTLHIDATGEEPQVANQSGFRWKSGAFPTWQPRQQQPAQQIQQPGGFPTARRLVADEAGFGEDDPDTVQGMVESYRQGYTVFDELVDQLASADYSDPSIDEIQGGSTWVDIYDRGESEPDPDSFFWVEAAADDGVLTHDQIEHIIGAIDQYHTSEGDDDFVDDDGEDYEVDDDWDDDYDDDIYDGEEDFDQ